MMVCTSCKTSYNVLSNSRLSGVSGSGSGSGSGDGWSLIFKGGGGGNAKRESLHILDFQRLASLPMHDVCLKFPIPSPAEFTQYLPPISKLKVYVEKQSQKSIELFLYDLEM